MTAPSEIDLALYGLWDEAKHPRGHGGKFAAAVERIQAEHPQVELHVHPSSTGNRARLSLIRTAEGQRGAGHAGTVMRKLTQAADEHGVHLTLTPEPLAGDRRTSKTRLAAWYKSHGFVENKGRNKDYEISDTMHRPPAGAVASAVVDEFNHALCQAEADLYGTAYCLATRKPGPCLGQHRSGTVLAPPTPVKIPAAPVAPTKNPGVDAGLQQAYLRAQQTANAAGLPSHLHGQIAGAMHDYAHALHGHQRAEAHAQAAYQRAQGAHDSAVARQAAQTAAYQARQAAAQAKAKAHTAHANLRHAARHKARLAVPAGFATDLYGIPLDFELYGLVSWAHHACNVGEFCRNPLHPGPCKGWKHTLHAIAPGAFHAYEKQRVARLNEKRAAKVKALQALGHPVPKHLLKPVTYSVPTAAHAQPGFTPPTPAQARGVLPATAKDIAGKIAQRHQASADAKLSAQAQSLHDVVTAIQGRTNVTPTGVVKALTAAKATQQPGENITDHPSVQKAISSLIGNLDNRTQGGLPAADRAQLHKDIAEHVENGTPGVPRSVQDAVDAAKRSTAPSAPTPAAPSVGKPDVSAQLSRADRAGKLDILEKLTPADLAAMQPAERNLVTHHADVLSKSADPAISSRADAIRAKLGLSAPAGVAPRAPLPVGTPAHVQHAAAVAHRTAPGMWSSKRHLEAYGKLTKAEYDALPDDTKGRIKADLDAAHAKFLDPIKRKGIEDIQDRLGVSAKPTAPTAPAPGHAMASNVQAALDAASSVGKGGVAARHRNRDDAVKALAGLTQGDFHGLSADQQASVLAALHHYHVDQQQHGMSVHDDQAEEAFKRYTGEHPALHRIKQAEADFRAGKISGEQLRTEYVHGRVQAPLTRDKAVRAAFDKEAARIAADNPTLPPHVRSTLIEVPANVGPHAYSAASQTHLGSNWRPAPRMSANDMTDLFAAGEDDLAKLDPLHRQLVHDLRNHVITTGLAPGSPWSDSTKAHLVDNVLRTSYSTTDVTPERLKMFDALPGPAQMAIKRQLRAQADVASSNHDKVRHLYALAQVNHTHLSDAQRDAVRSAASNWPTTKSLDNYRKLPPAEFTALATPIRNAILDHLDGMQKTVEASGPTRTFQAHEDPLDVLPSALAAHLKNERTDYSGRTDRQVASDLANYGTGVVNPVDRTRHYGLLGPSGYAGLDVADKKAVTDDLDGIAGNSGNSVPVRYAAQYTKDLGLTTGTPPHITTAQLTALNHADPYAPEDDGSTIVALTGLDKAGYDSLAKPYRDAIDARIATLPGSAQQILHARFHPSVAPTTPAGYVPTAAKAGAAPVPAHVQDALDVIYGVHPRAHTVAHQLGTYGKLRGSDFQQLNAQEQSHLLGDLSYIATTSKGPNADKARKLIDRFTPPGTASGQVPTPPIVPPANAVPGQVRYATPQTGTLVLAKDKGKGGDGWTTTSTGQRVWGKYGAAGLLLMHQDPHTGERRYLMVQRGPAISDPGKWQFPGGAIDEKETFHQGGAREVIEELGFKPDSLKDAQVHGEHTHSIPGSSWKYVSVAAQVPSMLKPDLSTHHARAETSDAKWMTESEIRKLDQGGKLLAPLAGGKLEQNVLSLFPSPAHTGPVAVQRPAPLTKRQKRLALPAGGRQSPNRFNAWPHAHKPSTGRNLLTDRSAIDRLRQDVKKARAQYDGKTADGRLAAIGAMQGFDDTPTVASKAEVDRLLATGDYIEAWRGVNRGGGKSAADINEELRTGPAYYGKGVFGNGYYLATQKNVAEQYADGTRNSVVRVLIPKSAVIDTHQKLAKEAEKIASPRSKAKGRSETGTLYDVGRYAAAKGIDGIKVEPIGYQGARGMSSHHVSKPGKEAYNWLNRSVLIVQEAQ